MELKQALEMERMARTQMSGSDTLTGALLQVIDSLRTADTPDSSEIDAVVALYHLHLPMLCKVQVITPKRRAQIVARWREHNKGGERKSLASFWSNVFQHASKSEFLTGTRGNDRGWRPNLDFFLQPSSMVKLLEGGYHTDEKVATRGKSNDIAYWLR